MSEAVKEYEVDYHDLENASQNVETLRSGLEESRNLIFAANKEIYSDDVFSGKVADSCKEALDVLNKRVELAVDNFLSMKNYFADVAKAYQENDKKASKLILSKDSDGKLVTVEKGLVGDTNEEMIFNYFKAKGLTDAEACGIMACIYHESRFLPGADRDVPGDESYGICQWLAERRTALEDYCKSNNKEVSDLEAQLDFIFYECETTQKKAAMNNLLAITDETEDAAAAAADRWLIDYEGCGKSKQSYPGHTAIRQEKARELYQKYHKEK